MSLVRSKPRRRKRLCRIHRHGLKVPELLTSLLKCLGLQDRYSGKEPSCNLGFGGQHHLFDLGLEIRPTTINLHSRHGLIWDQVRILWIFSPASGK